MEINKHCTLSVTDYSETEQPEPTSRCIPAPDDDLMEWIGRGEIAGLRAKAYYYTTDGDQDMVAEADGDNGCIDWDKRLRHVAIVTDDDVDVVIISNPDYSER